MWHVFYGSVAVFKGQSALYTAAELIAMAREAVGRFEESARGGTLGATFFSSSTGTTLSDLLRDAAVPLPEGASSPPARSAGLSASVMTDPALRLLGSTGNDTLTGGSGNDTLIGSAGADVMVGGAGTDVADYSRSNAAVVVDLGTPGAQSGGHAAGDTLSGIEALIGSRFADTFFSTGSGERFDGRGGFDWVSFENMGGLSIDLQLSSAANDGVYLSIEGFVSGGGNDTLSGRSTAEHFIAGAGSDTLFGSRGADTLDGGSGNDTVNYSSGGGVRVDLSSGGRQAGGLAERDILIGIENVYGSATEANVLKGDSDNNNLFGGTGNDIFYVGDGIDNFFGGDGFDIIDFTNSAVLDLMLYVNSHYIYGSSYAVRMYSIEGIIGNATDNYINGQSGNDYVDGAGGNDYLFDGLGNDTVLGGSGNDVLYWQGGNDVFNGGSGIDRFDASWVSSAIRIENGTLTTASGTGVVKGFEVISGSSGADTIYGGAGAETLIGGAGDDVLRGGGGRDRFQFTPGSRADVILDFNKRMDKVALSSSQSGIVTITDSGADKVISWTNGSVTLVGHANTAFTTGDILFV